MTFRLRRWPPGAVSGSIVSTDGQAGWRPVRIMAEDAADTPLEQEIATTVTDRAGRLFSRRACRPLFDPRGQGGAASRRPVGSINRYPHRERNDLVSRTGKCPLVYGPVDVRWATFPLAVGRDDISNLSLTLRSGLTIVGRAEFVGAREKPGARLYAGPGHHLTQQRRQRASRK